MWFSANNYSTYHPVAFWTLPTHPATCLVRKVCRRHLSINRHPETYPLPGGAGHHAGRPRLRGGAGHWSTAGEAACLASAASCRGTARCSRTIGWPDTNTTAPVISPPVTRLRHLQGERSGPQVIIGPKRKFKRRALYVKSGERHPRLLPFPPARRRHAGGGSPFVPVHSVPRRGGLPVAGWRVIEQPVDQCLGACHALTMGRLPSSLVGGFEIKMDELLFLRPGHHHLLQRRIPCVKLIR